MQVEITDPSWEKPSAYNGLERLALRVLKDERDLIFIRTMAAITVTVFPVVVLLFLSPDWVIGLAAIPYIGWLFLTFAGRYGLMLHANGHRPIFKRQYQWMGLYVPWVLGFFFGHTPTSFAAHHVGMHHAENNMEADGSSTLAYQRDHLLHFVHYWGRFFVMGYINLTRYFLLRGRRRVALRFLAGELGLPIILVVAFYLNWAAALLVFVVPFLMMRWLLMAGNFAQHAFVDVDDPDNPYKNSNCLINTNYNHKAYNDGYHIVHHIRAGMHWSEMPQWFKDHYDTFVQNDAIVFSGINDNQQVWILLMTRNYDKLANCLVNFRGRTHEEKVAFLKTRVRRRKGTLPKFFGLETLSDVERTRRKPTPVTTGLEQPALGRLAGG